MEVALAAQMYYREHRRFPESPLLLVNGDLITWPLDPFSRTETPVQYRLENDGTILLWCVGPNETDDGGHVDVRENAADYDQGMLIALPH